MTTTPRMDDNETYISNLTHLKRSSTQVPDQPEPGILESFQNRYAQRDYWITFQCPEFTTQCPVTGQPDFGSISVRYIPDSRCIESKSLKLRFHIYKCTSCVNALLGS